MDNQLYEEIIRDLIAIGGMNVNDKFISELCFKYPRIPEDILRSIISLWYQRKVSKTSYRVKDFDIYTMYNNRRKRGDASVCQQLARDLDYPPSLVAKIVVSGYAREVKARNRGKFREARDLRREQNSCSKCDSTSNSRANSSAIRTSDDIQSLKKHNDPRVELALNLFDAEDEIGKYFLEKFNPRNQCNVFTGELKSADGSIIQNQTETSRQEKLAARMFRNFSNVKINDTSTQSQKEEKETFLSITMSSLDASISTNTSYSESQPHDTSVCTCPSGSDSDNTDTDSEDSDDECEYSVKELLENTSLIDDPVLAADVLLCTLSDDQYGPTSDIIGHSSGITYELLLEEYVKSVGLSYKTENKLRGVGVDKTPDIILQVPVAVNNFVINWIESKALFADYKLHQELKKNQYKHYINRFGPGLVIYWRGYVSDLPDLYLIENKTILVRDNFPPKESFTCINVNKFRFRMESEEKPVSS